jgi:hypothetical protein
VSIVTISRFLAISARTAGVPEYRLQLAASVQAAAKAAIDAGTSLTSQL